MNRLGSYIAKYAMALVYTVLKMVTTVDHTKIAFLGRRMDRIPLDFRLLLNELKREHPEVRHVIISQMYKGGFFATVKFAPALVRSLYHLATSKVCVLDSYWPAVSVLNHRQELSVYQIWHSLGKIKQSGLQTLGRKHGRDQFTAGVMKMHHGYDFVIAGAKIWNPQYVESFGIDEKNILNFGLPRSDYLVNERHAIEAKIRVRYPMLGDKEVILYAPTFRRGLDAEGALKLVAAIDHQRFTLVIKMHGSDTLIIPEEGHVVIPDFSATELLTIADYLVTDYSSIALEAAILEVNTFYYVYDREEYLRHNGLNIDLSREMPNCVFENVDDLNLALAKEYPHDTLKAYRAKFIIPDLGHSTSDLADHIINVGELCSH